MTKKKSTLKVKKSTGSAECSVFASFAMACPLCRVTVPANTQHTCKVGG